MNTTVKVIAAALLGAGIGYGLSLASTKTPTTASHAKSERKPLYWVAPMDPTYKRDKPGKSPMGMDLIPVYEEDASGAGIKIDQVEAHNLAIKTGLVRRGPFEEQLHTVGRVAYNDDLQIHVHTRVSGWIEKLDVKAEGDWVRKGQKLFSLYSPELVNAQQEYLTALASGDKQLLQASRARLAYLGLTSSQIDTLKRRKRVQDRIEVRALRAGFVGNIDVGEGEFVTPKDTIMSISGLDSVWVLVDVFERDIGLIEQGMPVDIRLEAYPGERWQGRVDHLYPALNPRSRTMLVRVVVDNAGHRLRPHMLARVSMEREAQEAVLVPKAAVIRGRVNRVIRVTDDNHYQVTVVEIGRENDRYVEVRAGLEPGDRVVTSSQFLIDSESNLDEALKRFEQAKAALQTVFGQGVVEAVNREKRSLTISHQPIDALDWPAMTMNFIVAEGVTIPADLTGASIHFGLFKTEEGYRINQIHVVEAGSGAGQGQMDHGKMDHGPMDHGKMDHGQMDQGQMDQGQMDHGQMDHGQKGMGQEDAAHGNQNGGGQA